MTEEVRPGQLALEVLYKTQEVLGFPREEQVAGWRNRVRENTEAAAREMGFSEEQCQKVADIAENLYDTWVCDSEIWKIEGINAEIDFGISE